MGISTGVYGIYGVALSAIVFACGVEPTTTASVEQPGINMQGINMQGINMQGMAMQGFSVDGASLAGAPLGNVRIERGELWAEQGGAPLRGAALVGAHLFAQVRNLHVSPPTSARVEYRITAITPEVAQYDPTRSGNTYLYALEQWVAETGLWQAACAADADGKSLAIPVAAIFDERGDRKLAPSLFTFGCTSGVIAKCYRWGYRPWLTGEGDLASIHWACTRLARADYCGDGRAHTFDATEINVWDLLPAPGPIQLHGDKSPQGMHFEAGWSTSGAVCLSHERWKGTGPHDTLCPGQQLPTHPKGDCNTVSDVLATDPSVLLFTESRNSNVHPPQ